MKRPPKVYKQLEASLHNDDDNLVKMSKVMKYLEDKIDNEGIRWEWMRDILNLMIKRLDSPVEHRR